MPTLKQSMSGEFVRLLTHDGVCIKQVHCSDKPRPMCFIASEHAYADSVGEDCASTVEARDVAARRFLELLEQHGGNDRAIGNIGERSRSPASPEQTRPTLTRMRSLSDCSTYVVRKAEPVDDARDTQSATSSPRNDILLLLVEDDDTAGGECRKPKRPQSPLKRILSGFRKKK